MIVSMNNVNYKSEESSNVPINVIYITYYINLEFLAFLTKTSVPAGIHGSFNLYDQ